MKKYAVEVCQPMWAVIMVEAENEEEAEVKAFDLKDDIPDSDFTEIGERYIPESNPQEIESIIETENGTEYILK